MLSRIQVLLLILVVFIFLPAPLTLGYLIFLFIYTLLHGYLKKSLLASNKSKLLLLLGFFSLLTSIFHHNILGAMISIILIIIVNILLVYRHNLDRNFFYLLIKFITIMSFFCSIVGLIQFHFISLELHSSNPLIISDKPEYRVSSVFGNANHYATILEFVILLAFYKLFLVKDKESSFTYYLTIIVLNAFMLYLTGCRTAWIALFITIPIMFLFQKKFYVGLSLIIMSMLGLYIVFAAEIFPRLDSLAHDFAFRFQIWVTSFKGFLQHPIFGIGPFGYQMIYIPLGGPKAIHSHSLYLEILLSYGLSGLTIVMSAIILYLKELFSNSHKESYSFAVGVLLVVALHSFVDATIIDLQVGLLFLMIISSTKISDF